jgi:nucleotide-binding universal stress UspA family protein
MADAAKILIPLDGSPVAESILLSIAPMFGDRHSTCTLFHVADPANKPGLPDVKLDSYRKALEDQGARVNVLRSSGKAAAEIVREAVAGRYDFVAMSTHGRSGLELVEMGSVAEEVIRLSPVPVLLCRSGTWSSGWDPILVALDGTVRSEEILQDVIRIARVQNSTVHLLQVGLGLLMSDSYRGVAFDMTPVPSTSYLERAAADLKAKGLNAIPEHRSGQAASEIAHLARELGAGLICMATGGMPDELPGMERSVTAKVIRNAPCPVFVRRMSPATERSTETGKGTKSAKTASSSGNSP